MARRTSPEVGAHPTAAQPGRPPRSVPVAVFFALRPSQFTKNLVVFAALIFAQRLMDPAATVRAGAAFFTFCVLSGVVYLINDVVDQEQDRRHPIKRYRPVASGELSTGTAIGAAVGLGAGALAASFTLSTTFGLGDFLAEERFRQQVAYARAAPEIFVVN